MRQNVGLKNCPSSLQSVATRGSVAAAGAAAGRRLLSNWPPRAHQPQLSLPAAATRSGGMAAASTSPSRRLRWRWSAPPASAPRCGWRTRACPAAPPCRWSPRTAGCASAPAAGRRREGKRRGVRMKTPCHWSPRTAGWCFSTCGRQKHKRHRTCMVCGQGRKG